VTTPPMSSLSIATAVWAPSCAGAAAISAADADRRYGQTQPGFESSWGALLVQFFCMALAAYARLGTRARRLDCAQSMSPPAIRLAAIRMRLQRR